MAKNSVRDFDATAANNTDIQSVDIAENCAPSGINNAIRELMTDLKNVSAGTVALESPQADSMTVTGDLTVDTNTLYVDSTNNRVGVGTASPSSFFSDANQLVVGSGSGSQGITISSGTSENSQVFFADGTSGDAAYRGIVRYLHSSDAMAFYTSGANERMRIDSSGDVGIGTSSPGHPLHVSGNGFGTIAKFSADDGANNPRLLIYGSSDGMHIQRTSGSGAANLMSEVGGGEGGGTEAMRIDSSGDLFVSKTSQNVATDGHELRADGVTVHTANGACPLFLNRRSSDGAIVTLMKAGTTVGSINSRAGEFIAIGYSDTYLEFNAGSNQINPSTGSAGRDNVIDLGSSSARFDDIFATNGTINTSDQNEKQDIVSLTDAEITAAKAISKLFKTFKWNDKVEAKGDAARTHAGVIAQEVQQAMTDAGLDATKYAFFCSDTWWETQTEVPAVEAVEAVDAVYEDVVIEAVLDDEGNEVEPERTEQRLVSEAVEAVEAQDAYTRTDTYDTVEEAPEGATERTRLGIRYPELLAFVGAATEQRLADIETRLTALEA